MSHASPQQPESDTASRQAAEAHPAKNPPETLPPSLATTISALPKLTREQCGHLRHFHNLISQPDGEWSLMGADSGQEYDDAFRYQLSAMTYAAGAAHYHRLPALRSVFRDLIQKLISKMLLPEVWGYWFLTSQSGKRADPDIQELRKPWADPVCRENVMYSGHLLLMVSLYSMLFGDDRYDQEDSIVFDWSPMWWGMGPERFSYTRMKLQETIHQQMEQNGWIGACCEPNMVFIVCNQFPLIATRYNDVWNGTSILDDVLVQYKKAWASRGFLSENGLFRKFYAVRQDRVSESQELSHSAWVMAFMPWNYDQVQSMYPTTGVGFFQHIDGRLNLHPPALASAIKNISTTEHLDPESPAVVERARKEVSEQQPQPSKPRFLLPTFGKVAQWLSEIAGSPDLDALLKHADQYLNPSWNKGGLYYARNDQRWDEQGNYVHMEAYSGNAGIAYGRLNVQNGQKRMWDAPWTKEEVWQRPCIEGVGLENGVDFVRGVWMEERKVMVVTMRSWDGTEVLAKPVCRMLPVGRWGVYVDGRLKDVVVVKEEGEDVGFEIKLRGEDVDLVVVDLA